jgi:sugar phosphate permease
MSARWGGAATPYLTYLVLQVVSWRMAFLLFGLLGVVWGIIFYAWYRDRPQDHPSVNAAELALLPKGEAEDDHLNVPWATIASSPAIWLLCGQYFACSYAWYFFVTWFPTYLIEVHRFDLKQSALLAGLPLFLGGFGSMFSGWLTPHLQRWMGDAAMTRRIVGMVGMLGAAACLVLATRLQQPILAVLAIAVASFFNDITMPGSWTTCMEVGGRYVGTIAGTMNMMGNFGGVFSPIALGYIVGRTGDWNLTFFVTAALYVLGALCWWAIDPVTPLEEQQRRRLARRR